MRYLTAFLCTALSNIPYQNNVVMMVDIQMWIAICAFFFGYIANLFRDIRMLR